MFEVRDAAPEDAAAIAEINVRGWQYAFRHLFPNEYLDSMDPGERTPLVAD